MRCFLGIDSSTQSCSGIVVDVDTRRIVYHDSVSYGQDLPQFGCPNGYLYPDDSAVQRSNPLMWVEALEMLFERGGKAGFDWSTIAGIACSGQQHGSVYLGEAAVQPDWQPSRRLAEQVEPMLTRREAPIWMDSSTSEECREIESRVGRERVLQITGSVATERFTGPQIRRFYKEDPTAYEKTARVHLVSSFMAFLLAGQDAPIDYGDGAGMNLMDLAHGRWHPDLLAATAPNLEDKLPSVVPSSTVVGTVARYFVEKYGFSPAAQVVVSSGDNPCSLVGMGAGTPGGAVVISLGTSDTYFAAMSEPRTDPGGYGHVFGNPAGGFMSLICFKNGSLTREHVARRFGFSWEAFGAAVQATPPGNNGNLMLPYIYPEITPRILEPRPVLFGSDAFVKWEDGQAAARAVIEAQALAMRLHSQWIADKPRSIRVTGGASANDAILQTFADVFQIPLSRLSVSNSAALGAALRAANAVGKIAWEDLYAAFAVPEPRVFEPDPATAETYNRLLASFQEKRKQTFGVD